MSDEFRFGMGKARPDPPNKVKVEKPDFNLLGMPNKPLGPTPEELVRSIPDKDAHRCLADLFLCAHGLPEKASAKNRDLWRSGVGVEPMYQVFRKRGAVDAINLPEIAGDALARVDLPKFNGLHQKITRFVKAANFKDHEFLTTVDDIEVVEVPELGEIPITPVHGQNHAIQITSSRARVPVIRRKLFDGALNFLQIPEALGRAALRKEARDVYGLLENNPTLTDGSELFTTGNDVTASPYDIAAGLAVFRAQKTSLTGTQYALMEPKYFVVPPDSEEAARTRLVNLDLKDDIDLIVSPLVTYGYLLADPDINPVLIRLGLNEQPLIETRGGSNVIDGIVIDLFHDFKIGAISRVGAVRIGGV